MKRYTAGQLIRFLSPVVAVTTLLILAGPVGFWLALGTFVLGAIMLIPAFALALFLRAISRSPVPVEASVMAFT